MPAVLEKEEQIRQIAEESPCICFNLRKSARIITQIYDNMFRPLGLTATQVSILGCLKKVGGMTISELSKAMATDRTTLTRNLKPLQRNGLIEVVPGVDRRSREVTISAKGNDLVDQAFALWKVFKGKMDRKIGQDRIDFLCKELAEVLDLIS